VSEEEPLAPDPEAPAKKQRSLASQLLSCAIMIVLVPLGILGYAWAGSPTVIVRNESGKPLQAVKLTFRVDWVPIQTDPVDLGPLEETSCRAGSTYEQGRLTEGTFLLDGEQRTFKIEGLEAPPAWSTQLLVIDENFEVKERAPD
jgi:hypothetical protein